MSILLTTNKSKTVVTAPSILTTNNHVCEQLNSSGKCQVNQDQAYENNKVNKGDRLECVPMLEENDRNLKLNLDSIHSLGKNGLC